MFSPLYSIAALMLVNERTVTSRLTDMKELKQTLDEQREKKKTYRLI